MCYGLLPEKTALKNYLRKFSGHKYLPVSTFLAVLPKFVKTNPPYVQLGLFGFRYYFKIILSHISVNFDTDCQNQIEIEPKVLTGKYFSDKLLKFSKIQPWVV